VIRVAFPLIGGRGWTGGYNYLLNLLRVLQSEAAGQATPVVLFGPDAPAEDHAPFAAISGVEIVVDPAFGAAGKARRLAEAMATGLDRAAARAFRVHDIDLVFEAAQFYGWRLPLPAMAWIPDFQHRHLPHLFSRTAQLRRALGFNAQVWSGRQIMLSSEDARNDCERFHPASRGRTSVVRFAIPRALPVDPAEARAAADRHGLPDRFFFLPNQFWMHKNHAVVIEALGLLRAAGRDVVVAASGNTVDPRDPGHFDRLCARAAEVGVSGLFRPLGLIPYGDIALLMRSSTALINPSLFEGWSTTVEEAKATGTPMILSDLRVHREQAASDVAFFDPLDPTELAELLGAFVPRTASAREDAAVSAALLSRSAARAFADAFMATAAIARSRF
jgi:glycosyltransferase involved in cell wall biosynthesis